MLCRIPLTLYPWSVTDSLQGSQSPLYGALFSCMEELIPYSIPEQGGAWACSRNNLASSFWLSPISSSLPQCCIIQSSATLIRWTLLFRTPMLQCSFPVEEFVPQDKFPSLISFLPVSLMEALTFSFTPPATSRTLYFLPSFHQCVIFNTSAAMCPAVLYSLVYDSCSFSLSVLHRRWPLVNFCCI